MTSEPALSVTTDFAVTRELVNVCKWFRIGVTSEPALTVATDFAVTREIVTGPERYDGLRSHERIGPQRYDRFRSYKRTSPERDFFFRINVRPLMNFCLHPFR